MHVVQNIRRQAAAQRKRIRKKDDTARANRTAEEQVQHDLFGDEGVNAGVCLPHCSMQRCLAIAFLHACCRGSGCRKIRAHIINIPCVHSHLTHMAHSIQFGQVAPTPANAVRACSVLHRKA